MDLPCAIIISAQKSTLSFYYLSAYDTRMKDRYDCIKTDAMMCVSKAEIV